MCVSRNLPRKLLALRMLSCLYFIDDELTDTKKTCRLSSFFFGCSSYMEGVVIAKHQVVFADDARHWHCVAPKTLSAICHSRRPKRFLHTQADTHNQRFWPTILQTYSSGTETFFLSRFCFRKERSNHRKIDREILHTSGIPRTRIA